MATKVKKKTPTWYRKKCVNHAKKEAKKRDNYTCQKSGVKVEGKNAHGSHILPEGAYPLMSAEPYNIITLSYKEHINWWHKNPLEASAWFENKWPGRYKELRAMAEEKRKHIVNWESVWKGIKGTG
mgnify:CR=1 FL=1